MQMSTLPPQRQQSILFRITIVQMTTNGCCDFIAQCTLVSINCQCRLYLSSVLTLKFSKIYRCWIVWGKNTHIIIVPSFLALIFISQSIYLHLISRFQFIASSYLASRRRRINKRLGIFNGYLGRRAVHNRFGRIHGR